MKKPNFLIEYFFRNEPQLFKDIIAANLTGNTTVDHTLCSTIKDRMGETHRLECQVKELKEDLAGAENKITEQYDEGHDEGYDEGFKAGKEAREKEEEAAKKIENLDLSHMTDWNKK